MSILDYIEKIKRENESPRITAQEPRIKYAGGQLVRNTADGSRPGYSGTSELDKATKYFTEGEFTKFDDIKGFKSDDPDFKKYKKMRDQIRHNIKYHGGKFEEPGTTFLVDQKTIDLENFLKNKKSIKQSVLIKKLEDLGYANPKEYINAVASKNPDLEVIRDVERIIPERESELYTKKELQKATAGEHKKDPKRITKSKYDALSSKEKEKIQMKLRQHGGNYLGPYRQIKDPLPVDIQKEIKFKFAGDYKGTWDFDNFKYGIEGVKDVNSRLYDAIKKHVNEPKPWRYAGAQLNTPEGWMMAQMDRAYRQGNKNYKPIYRTIGGAKKIVGFIDNTEAGGGKKYISAKEFIKGNDADGVLFSDPKKGHVDYANTKKFNSIALKVHGSPSKVITDILGKGGVEMFTESGKAKVQLKHVLSYLIDTKGLDKTIGGMVRHHKGGVFGAATQDYQILNKVINSRITGIEDRIRADEILPEDIAKLKKWGASVTHKGVTYGGGPKTAIGGLREIENLILKGSQDVELYGKKIKGIEKWNKKDFTEFNKYLQSFCGYGKSTGGRIGFKTGSCSPEVAKRNFLLATNDVSTGRVTGEAAEQIAKNAGKVVAKAGSKSALMSILGPAGIGLDIAFEVGSIGLDVAGGKSLNRALQDNWITGAFMPGTGQEEFHKELYATDSKAKPYGQALDLIDAYNKAQKNIEQIKQTVYRAPGQKEQALAVAERDLRGIEAQYNALTKQGKIMEEGSPEYENYMAAKTEFEDTAKAKSFGSEVGLKYQLDTPESSRFTPRDKPTGMKIDFNIPKGHTMDMAAPGAPMTTSFKPDLPTKENLNRLFQLHGVVHPRFGQAPEEVLDYMINQERIRQEMERPGIRGTQDWRGAGGGMVGIRKPNAIAPTGGPMSQGLRSLYINDKDY